MIKNYNMLDELFPGLKIYTNIFNFPDDGIDDGSMVRVRYISDTD
jgi:hypothetical protein